jgi:hypothetical protein
MLNPTLYLGTLENLDIRKEGELGCSSWLHSITLTVFIVIVGVFEK